MLAKMFNSEWNSNRDSSGAVLVDRDPKYFAILLNYLRCGQIILEDGSSIEGLYEEAKFFSIESIIDPLSKMVDKYKRKQENSFSRKELISILASSNVNANLRLQGIDLQTLDLSRLDLSHINFKVTLW